MIIAGAGKAAHLAGVMAAKSTLPVIGAAAASSRRVGLAAGDRPDAHWGPGGHGGIDGAVNAALLAVAILALSDEDLAASLSRYCSSWPRRRSRAERRDWVERPGSTLAECGSGGLHRPRRAGGLQPG